MAGKDDEYDYLFKGEGCPRDSHAPGTPGSPGWAQVVPARLAPYACAWAEFCGGLQAVAFVGKMGRAAWGTRLDGGIDDAGSAPAQSF